MFINLQNQLYVGDCAQGDREATPEEIAAWAWELARRPTYQQLRAAEYPPHTDYLDAIVKGESTQPYIDACLTVKAKYPKS